MDPDKLAGAFQEINLFDVELTADELAVLRRVALMAVAEVRRLESALADCEAGA